MTDAFSNRRTEAVLGERDAIPSVVPSPLQRASLSIQYHRAPSVHPVSRFTARVVKEIFAPLRSTLAFARIRIARFAPIAGVAVIAVIAIIVRVARAFARLRSRVLASPRSRSARV